MKLMLTCKVVGLTIGNIYEKILPVSDLPVFNVCVRNDDGEPQYVPFKNFKVIKDDIN